MANTTIPKKFAGPIFRHLPDFSPEHQDSASGIVTTRFDKVQHVFIVSTLYGQELDRSPSLSKLREEYGKRGSEVRLERLTISTGVRVSV